jgi:hypothetical protein
MEVPVRRKGELSKSTIDRNWPHQVALPERLSCREHWPPQNAFCEGLDVSPRGHCFVRNGEWWNVKCFAHKEDAVRFIERFGGEYMTPQTRPRH